MILALAPLPSNVHPNLTQFGPCIEAFSPATLASALAAHAATTRILVGNGGSQVPATLIAQLPALELITVCGVGYDGIDLDACRQRGVRVTNTPDVLTDDVADLATALVLMTSRQLLAANRFLQVGYWQQEQFPLATALAGKTAGILGLGRIGKAIAHRLQACGMKIAYHSRNPQDVPHTYCASPTELAQHSDFLILACPGGPATHHLVDADVLTTLGPTGILINIARGSVVDESALVHHLTRGDIGGVGLDVFENEPQVPAALLQHPRAVLLPHVGSATHETRTAMGHLCLENLAAHLSGKPLLTPVV